MVSELTPDPVFFEFVHSDACVLGEVWVRFG